MPSYRTSLYTALVAVFALAQLSAALPVPECSGDCAGSVMVTWSGADCVGNASVVAPNALFNNTNQNNCARYSQTSDLMFKWRCSGGIIIADQYNNAACTGSAFSSVHIRTGLCVNTPFGTSNAYFCSITAAEEAATVTLAGGSGVVPPGTPQSEDTVTECSGNNCPSGYLTMTGYSSSSCSGSPLGSAYLNNAKFGTCYNVSSVYSQQWSCGGDNIILNQFYGSGCNTTALVSNYIPTGRCQRLNTGPFFSKYTCGSASTIASPIALIISLIALSVFATLF